MNDKTLHGVMCECDLCKDWWLQVDLDKARSRAE